MITTGVISLKDDTSKVRLLEIVEEQEEEEMYLSEEFSKCLKGGQLVRDLVTSPSPHLGCRHSSLSVIARSNLNKTVNEEGEEVTKGGLSYPDPPSRSNSLHFDSGFNWCRRR